MESTRKRFVLVALVLLLAYARQGTAQTICPTGSTNCTGGFNFLSCDGFGTVNQLPPVCSNPTTIQALTVGGTSKTLVMSIQARAFQGLVVNQLILQGLGIRTLDPAAFQGLGATLQTLVLSNNQISTLPDGVFSSLTVLVRLQLDGNQLTGLGSGAFLGLGSLTYLNLQGNQITTISSTTFQPTPKLQTLIMNNNLIANLPTNVFSTLGSLIELSLANNQISNIDDSTLSGLSSLQLLYAQNNQIQTMTSTMFSESQLQVINLASNRITSFPNESFIGTQSLLQLYLNDNQLQSIPVNIFLNMGSLQVLYLQDNQISSILQNSFSGLPWVQYFNISNNQISSIPIGLFDPFGSTIQMDLSNNAISLVSDKPFKSCHSLQSLNLTNNKISKITADWFTTTLQLADINLSQNQITTIQAGSFDQLQSAAQMDLSNNLLTNVSGLFTQVSSLKSLILSGNPLGSLDGNDFNGLTSLTRLDVVGSCLQNVTFQSSLQNLAQLYLRHNLVQNITSGAFSGVPALNVLDLGYNYMSDIGQGALSGLLKLQLLNLTANQFTSDQLSSLSNMATGVSVDLTWNRLTTLDSLPTFGSVYLARNPLICSCQSANSSWPSTISQFIDYAQTVCFDGTSSSTKLIACYWSDTTQCSNTTTFNLQGSSICSSSAQLSMPTHWMNYNDLLVLSCPSKAPPPALMFLEFSVNSTSSSQVLVRWVVADVVDAAGYQITYHLVTDNTTHVMSVNNANLTEVEIGGLISSFSYSVCAQILLLKENRLNSTLGDIQCSYVTLPVAEPTTSGPLVANLTIWANDVTDSTIPMSWKMVTSRPNNVVNFRISFIDTTTTTSVEKTVTISNTSQSEYTITGLTSGHVYTVCVEATMIDAVNITQCTTVTTTASSSIFPLLWIILIPIAAALAILACAVIIGCIACRKSRRRREEAMKAAARPTLSNPECENVVHNKLSEQKTMSLDIYDSVNEIQY